MVQIGNHWDALLKEEFQKPYYQKLRAVLAKEYQTQTVYPSMYDIFNALRTTDYPDVKAVILGQDPYHGPNQAHGLCFSVQPGVPAPPSLKNIFKELQNEYGLPIPNTGYLMPWAKRGVLLLNTVLTVRAGQPNSHKGLGWETLTDTIITMLNRRTEPMVFFLWGANARQKTALLTNPQHLVLSCAHPSPLSAFHGFFGCNHFRLCNEFLENHGMTPIDWSL